MAKVNVKVKKRESLSDIFKGIASGVTGFFVFVILCNFLLTFCAMCDIMLQ